MNERLRIASLEAQLETALKELDMLREAMGLKIVVPLELGLTKNEAIILGVLMKKEIAHKKAIWLTIYAAKAEEDEAEQKIIDVWVCKMRPKLKRFDIEIQTAWGVGYFLSSDDKAKILAMGSQAEYANTNVTSTREQLPGLSG